MFENIGGKIKMLASVICWTGIAVSLIVGVVFIVIAPLAGIAIIILGPFSRGYHPFSLTDSDSL